MAPVSPGSLAYVYVNRNDEDSDEESLVNDLWDLNIDEESEDEDEDEEVESEDDQDDDFDAGDLPDNVKSNFLVIFLLETKLTTTISVSFLQRSFR